MPVDFAIPPLNLHLSTMMEAGDGANLYPPFSSNYLAMPSLAGDIFAGYDSETYKSDVDEASDDDEEMSDGGAQIDMSSAHAEQLNAEMDLVDAEVMGFHNLAVLATSSTFLSNIYTQHATVDGFPEPLPVQAGTTNYGPADVENEGSESLMQETNASDPMSAVSQQLQGFQGGQEQGDFFTPAPAHGNFPSHSIESLSSTLPPSWVIGHGDGSPSGLLHVLPPVVDLGVAVEATTGSLLDVIVDGQTVDDSQSLSDLDWGDESSDEGQDIEFTSLANLFQSDDHRNFNLHEFLAAWADDFPEGINGKRNKSPKPNLRSVGRLRAERPIQVQFSDLHGDRCDIQGIDWTRLEVSRREARKRRSQRYKSYTNLRPPSFHKLTLQRSIIKDHENYFRFQRMDFKPKIFLSHFQLRNLIACTSRNNVCYAGESKVHSVNPLFDQKAVRLDLTDPVIQTANALPFNGIQISTIAADHNVLIAGGFAGEYAMTSLGNKAPTDHIEGLVTTDPNPITNHIQIHLNRQSGLPQASFASNDNSLRILDCTSNTMVAHHRYGYAINCSALSPDHRLRVIVGDHKTVMICDAEKGEALQKLAGHVDYGFACAWADNGWHVATGNQDKLIKIWDARMWTDHAGVGQPIQTIAATVAGIRSLKFSPLGSGKRVLVAAEAADVINVINAETYATKQTLDFFGEICGIDFTPDGQALFVGIYDVLRGGIMEFEKCGFGGLDRRESFQVVSNDLLAANSVGQPVGFDWKSTNEEVVRDPRSIRTATHRQRRAARSWDMNPF